jgi:hypothetical protein
MFLSMPIVGTLVVGNMVMFLFPELHRGNNQCNKQQLFSHLHCECVLTVDFGTLSHEFTFDAGIDLISNLMVLTPLI